MGKLVIVVILALVVVWWLRSLRRAAPPSNQARHRASSTAQAIVPCAHCGVHLPRTDAVTSAASPGAFYCTEAHRLAAEGR